MTDYIFNLETTKIELHFDKTDYNALTDEQKHELKSAFLWSRTGGCWVSRAKEPNLYRAVQVAKKLGFMGEQREGVRITYEEQLQRQSERAEDRADRYEGYAANAMSKAVQMQKPINDMRGDIAFFTQPIIAGHSGSQAFARRRGQMFSRYEKGFEEHRKSAYFKDRADIARNTAEAKKFTNKGYLDRRIKECKKEIRKRNDHVIEYESILLSIENGEQKQKYNGEPYTADEVTEWIERQLELIEKAMDKQGYLENCLDELGGILFSKENIKVGYVVLLARSGLVEVISTGPQNISYKVLTGGAAGMQLTAAYAEIKEVVKSEEKTRPPHPFKIGEQFKAIKRVYEKGATLKCTTTEIMYEIVKASKTTIQLRPVGTTDKPVTRKPSKGYNNNWVFSLDDTYGNTFYKAAE